MPIKDRNLKAGDRLSGYYHKQHYSCEVVEGENSKLRYRLADGREFKSPSAAGMAITGKSCNGWAFWSLETANYPSFNRSSPRQRPMRESLQRERSQNFKKLPPIRTWSRSTLLARRIRRVFPRDRPAGIATIAARALWPPATTEPS